jgi:hypothetical protein
MQISVTEICIERLKQKLCRRVFFSKLQNGELNQDGVSNQCFFSFGSHKVIPQPILKCIPILNLS